MTQIQVDLTDEANKLVEIYQTTENIKTKEEAINKLIIEAKQIITKKFVQFSKESKP